MKTLLLLVLLPLTSCGSSSDSAAVNDKKLDNDSKSVAQPSADNDTRNAQLVDKEANRPECKENKAQLIYVLETKEFQACGEGGWEVVEVSNTTTNNTTTNTTVNNSFIGVSVYEDEATGRLIYLVRAVQKTRVAKACADGFHAANEEEFEWVTRATKFWNGQHAANPHHYYKYVWLAVAGSNSPLLARALEPLYAPAFWSTGYYRDPVRYPFDVVENAQSVVCIK